jgi:hypothetical protein
MSPDDIVNCSVHMTMRDSILHSASGWPRSITVARHAAATGDLPAAPPSPPVTSLGKCYPVRESR